jgi:hypothetical protein
MRRRLIATLQPLIPCSPQQEFPLIRAVGLPSRDQPTEGIARQVNPPEYAFTHYPRVFGELFAVEDSLHLEARTRTQPCHTKPKFQWRLAKRVVTPGDT